MFARFFAWIGRLMRRRFIAFSSVAVAVSPPPPPPPPPPPGTVGQFLFNQTAQSGQLVLLEDI